MGARHEPEPSRRRWTACSAARPPARTATRSPAPTTTRRRPCRSPSVDVGDGFTVSRIPEELEFTPGLLDFLEASASSPGTDGTITAASPDGTITVEIDGHHVGVGAFASARILVSA